MGATTCPKLKKQVQAVKKNYQAQSKKLIQKFHFINLDHANQSQACLCHILKAPKMDWTVKDGLYHRFLKWCLKCENILKYELAALPE